jgi:uncharacterized membrane protein YgcG
MELDKFIKMIPGSERKVYNVDLHALTYAFQTDHHHSGDLKDGEDKGKETAKTIKGKTTGSYTPGGSTEGGGADEGGGGAGGGLG